MSELQTALVYFTLHNFCQLSADCFY